MPVATRTIEELRELRLDHQPFIDLLPSEKQLLLQHAVKEELHWPAQLDTFASGLGDRTYAVVRILGHRRGNPARDEWVTFLVAFDRSRRGRPTFEDGHYGFTNAHDAMKDMFRRANR